MGCTPSSSRLPVAPASNDDKSSDKDVPNSGVDSGLLPGPSTPRGSTQQEHKCAGDTGGTGAVEVSSNANTANNNERTVSPLPTTRRRPFRRGKRPKSLLNAAKSGDMVALRARLEEDGVDVNKRGMWESTPLIVACQYRHAEAAMELCGISGVDVAAVNEKGATALLHAAMEGLDDVVTKLLDMGVGHAGVGTGASTGAGAGAGAGTMVPQPAIVYNGPTDCNVPLTPLLGAALNGHCNIVKTLLASGANVNERHDTCTATAASASKDMHDRTPIGLASQCGHLDTVKLLHEHGANVNAVDDSGWSPLLLACDQSHEDVALFLLKHGGDVNVQHGDVGSLLHVACKRGMIAVVTAVITMSNNDSMDVNGVDGSGNTPLLLACGATKHRPRSDTIASEIASALLGAGADPTICTKAGQSPLEAAQRRRFTTTVELLQAALDERPSGTAAPVAEVGEAGVATDDAGGSGTPSDKSSNAVVEAVGAGIDGVGSTVQPLIAKVDDGVTASMVAGANTAAAAAATTTVGDEVGALVTLPNPVGELKAESGATNQVDSAASNVGVSMPSSGLGAPSTVPSRLPPLAGVGKPSLPRLSLDGASTSAVGAGSAPLQPHPPLHAASGTGNGDNDGAGGQPSHPVAAPSTRQYHGASGRRIVSRPRRASKETPRGQGVVGDSRAPALTASHVGVASS